MHSNKIMFSIVLDDCPFYKDLNLLKCSLLLTVKNLVHFRFAISFYKGKIIIFDFVACYELNFVFNLILLHNRISLESS